MFTKDEKRALLYLAVVAAAGGLLRAVRAPEGAPGAPMVAPAIAGDDLARQAQLVRQATLLARPLQPGERIDIDRAGAQEIERLPRVGPALARRIVEERDSGGPFGSPEGLLRVPGIGPGMLKAMERQLAFSGVARERPVSSADQPAGTRAATPGEPRAGRGRSGKAGCTATPAPVALNRATAAELACVPGIGPALAERITSDRARRGPFREVKELERVAGIGPALIARLAPHLSAP